MKKLKQSKFTKTSMPKAPTTPRRLAEVAKPVKRPRGKMAY
jgi:hypothetical protein